LSSNLVYIFLHSAQYFSRKSSVNVDKIIIQANENVIQANGSTVGPDNNTTAVSIHFRTLIELKRPIFIRFNLKQMMNGAYVKSFLDMDFELCGFYKSTGMIPVFKTVYSYARQFGIIPMKCPIKRGYYYIKNFVVTSTQFPDVLPSNKYWFDVSVTNGPSSNLTSVMNFSLYISFEKYV
jgi:Protein of unknown function (DUF1091)